MAWTLVTGGAKRLGEQLCLALAQAGYPVVVHYNKSRKEALQVSEKCRSFGVESACIQGDFSTIESTQDFVQRYSAQFPQTENLINNVGNYLVRSALNTSVEEWMSIFQTNLQAPFILIKHLLPSITSLKGSIINIGVSGLGRPHANIHATAYHIAKSSLWSLTRTCAKELVSQGVRVNMISPGYLPFAIDLPKDLSKIPSGHVIETEEVTRVLLFLLDRQNISITGQNIEVAGGVGL